MNIELKSKEVLDLFDKYRKELGLDTYDLQVGYDFEKEVFLKIKIKGNFTKLNYDTCRALVLELVTRKDKEPYVRCSSDFGNLNIGFTNVKQLKLLTKFIDELLKINIHELPEYIEFLKLKEKEENLKIEKKKLEEQLEKQKEEIDKKLQELSLKE
jgi:hypothetical protein